MEIKVDEAKVSKTPGFLKKIAENVANMSSSVAPRCPHKISHNFTEFLTLNEMSGSQTAAMLWAYYVCAHDVFEVKTGAEGEVCFTISKTDGTVLTIKRDDDFPTGVTIKEITAELWAFALEALAKSPKHMYDLVAAQQVSYLDEKNIESYYKMANVTVTAGSIHRVLPYFAAKIVNIAGTEGFEGVVKAKGGKWLSYHTSATSTPQLVQQMIEGTHGLITISDDVKNAVTAALAAPWDGELADLIPRNVVAVTHVFLDAMGKLPPKWYQGEKAVNVTSPIVLNQWKYVFSRYKSLAANEAAVNAVANVPDLVAKATELRLAL